MIFEVDAVLFDIDGTLVDSTPVVERTWRTWGAAHGYDAEEILRVCHGRRTADTVAMFIPPDGRAAAVAELEALERADFDGVVALPGAAALLDRLAPHRWAAVTSGPRALMRARLAAAGLPAPDVLVAAEDVTAGKPDPEGYRKAAAALGFDARRCLVVEDAPAGLAAGRAAGAATVAVATSHALAELNADAAIPDLTPLTVTVTERGVVVTVR
ncbi:HAD-IA family hydrolase [Dactylosporangium vinaceum]|uniref:HAD-IA family hydrolase n=1 Tax=Dactylosporangium vinaceum TaxID=53362 RepID=A0ABV5MDH5_9ACTN|nr:HAD-IA family hydrolase [Dactylosporangium vinaceum]UAC01151.1 HAD-IA family hydrolase [Dactylosporangium vinaceum]